ncbi:hypothetical protein HHU10_14535 [Tsukamurella columbiensis]|uniref:Uncharacterized protein n=1 Tax=Tsukamurella columbiensis TaxID=128509 RepID=A0ABX1LF26_9ACTN|nr:hypothetical protein [Tsukamurella columbiensis]
MAPPQPGAGDPVAPTSMHPVGARRHAQPRPIQPAPRPATGETATRPKTPETEEYDHNPATSIGLPPQRPQD